MGVLQLVLWCSVMCSVYICRPGPTARRLVLVQVLVSTTLCASAQCRVRAANTPRQVTPCGRERNVEFHRIYMNLCKAAYVCI